MSNIYCVVQAIENESGITIDQLIENTGLTHKQVSKCLYDASAAGYIDRAKNEEGRLIYTLTIKGSAWLLNRSVHHDAQPEVAKNTGSKRVATSPVVPPVTALAAEQPAAAVVSVTADAGSETTEHSQPAVEQVKNTGSHSSDVPLQGTGGAVEGLAAAPLATAATPAPGAARYCVLLAGEDYPTPEEAMQIAIDEFDRQSINNVVICEIRPVARIETRPVLVPL